MKRTISSVMGLAGLALMFGLGTAQDAQAKKACSNATLSGDYAVVITGDIAGLPFGALDLATADGNGNLSGKRDHGLQRSHHRIDVYGHLHGQFGLLRLR